MSIALPLRPAPRSPLFLVTLVAIARCSGGMTVTSSQRMGSLTGHLIGGRSPGGGDVECMWLEEPSGRRVDIFWPDGWDQDFDPLRLSDGTGRVVASEGDVLTVTGPVDGIGDSICSPGVVFLAETVEIVARTSVGPATSR
jgi:hypothetical protein